LQFLFRGIVTASITLLLTWEMPIAGGEVTRTNPPIDVAHSYVAMGDSYSSGENSPEYDPATRRLRDKCHRSIKGAWPELLGSTTLIACSGAKVSELFHPKLFRAAPDNVGQIDQLKALKRSRPVDLVTVTIGGNDLGFTKILALCFARRCLHHFTKNRVAAYHLSIELGRKVYPAIRDAVGHSVPVLVVGYPDIFPQHISDVVKSDCGWLSERNLELLNELERVLESELQRAARQAGEYFVSTRGALRRHELCTRHSFLKRIGPSCAFDQECGHPNVQGQLRIAAYVRHYLRTHLHRVVAPSIASHAAVATQPG